MKWSGAVEGCRACARELLGSLGCEKIGMRKSEISVLELKEDLLLSLSCAARVRGKYCLVGFFSPLSPGPQLHFNGYNLHMELRCCNERQGRKRSL